jgi:hypothetical protein
MRRPSCLNIVSAPFHFPLYAAIMAYSVTSTARRESNPAPRARRTDTLNVKSTKVSDDGKTVFLEIPDLHPVMQMLIQANGIESADGTPLTVEIANTINRVKGKTLVVGVEKVAVR